MEKVYCMCGDPDYMHEDRSGKCLEQDCDCQEFDKAIFKSEKITFEDGDIFKLAVRKEESIKSFTDQGFPKDKVRIYFLYDSPEESSYSFIVTGLKKDE